MNGKLDTVNNAPTGYIITILNSLSMLSCKACTNLKIMNKKASESMGIKRNGVRGCNYNYVDYLVNKSELKKVTNFVFTNGKIITHKSRIIRYELELTNDLGETKILVGGPKIFDSVINFRRYLGLEYSFTGTLSELTELRDRLLIYATYVEE